MQTWMLSSLGIVTDSLSLVLIPKRHFLMIWSRIPYMDLSAMEDTAHAQAYTQDSSTKPIINSDLEQEIALMCRG